MIFERENFKNFESLCNLCFKLHSMSTDWDGMIFIINLNTWEKIVDQIQFYDKDGTPWRSISYRGIPICGCSFLLEDEIVVGKKDQWVKPTMTTYKTQHPFQSLSKSSR